MVERIREIIQLLASLSPGSQYANSAVNVKEVNLKGLYLVSKYFILNLSGKTGTLISMSSTTSLSAIPAQTAYGSSKHATNRLVETMHLGAFCLSTQSHHTQRGKLMISRVP